MRLALPRKPPSATGSLAEAIVLARLLLTQTGQALGNKVAARLALLLREGDAGFRTCFFKWMTSELGPEPEALQSSASAYLADPSVVNAAKLTRAAEPSRQELLRRLNTAPQGTQLLVGLRGDLLALLPSHPELMPLDADMRHLLASWFNRGFLELRRLDWESPAEILEKLIRYEAVHAISDWSDLRSRLTGDRRCYAYFHPVLPGEPLIFIEVALAEGIVTKMNDLLLPLSERPPVDRPSHAIFYSISNCQPGLAGIPFGNFLIKHVADELGLELPSVRNFVTLSPIPGFKRWLVSSRPEMGSKFSEGAGARKELVGLCAAYLNTKSADRAGVIDPVAHFHLSNGAEIERITADADLSERGVRQSFGLMATYRYRPEALALNQEKYVCGGEVRLGEKVQQALRGGSTMAKVVNRLKARWAGQSPPKRRC